MQILRVFDTIQITIFILQNCRYIGLLICRAPLPPSCCEPFLLVPRAQGRGNPRPVQSTAQWLFPGSPTGRNPATRGYSVKVMVLVMSRGNSKCKWNLIVNPRSLIMLRREVDKTPLAPGALCCVQHRCDPNFLESFY